MSVQHNDTSSGATPGPHFVQARRKSSAWKVTQLASADAPSDVIDIFSGHGPHVQVTSEDNFDAIDVGQAPLTAEISMNPQGRSETVRFGQQAIDVRIDPAHGPGAAARDLVNRSRELANRIAEVEAREADAALPGQAESPSTDSNLTKSGTRSDSNEAPTKAVTKQWVRQQQAQEPEFGTRLDYQPLSSFLVPLMDLAMMPPSKVVPSADSFKSTYAGDQVADSLQFEANWEVDNFDLSPVARALSRDSLGELAKAIRDEVMPGLSRLAVTGVCTGEGRSTLAIALAQRFADFGERVVLVDADLVHPALADQMGLENDITWLTDEAQYEPAAEYLIRNGVDQLTLMPLTRPNRISFNKHAYEILDSLLSRIEPFFDRFIIDFGPVSHIDSATFRQVQLAQAAVFVHDPELSDVSAYGRAFDKFNSLGLQRFALAKNETCQ